MPATFKISNLKLFILIISVLSLFTFHFSLTLAQTPLQKAQQDYTYQFSKYRDAQQNYTSSKATYESFKTATAKNDAFLKTKDYLTQIDNLYISYLLLVKEYSQEIDWTNSNDQRIKINQIFDDETSYLGQHQQKVKNVQVLEELPPLAKTLKDYIDKVYQPKINKILATYEITRTKSLLEEFKQLSLTLDDYVNSKYSSSESSVLANWRSEIDNIVKSTNLNLDQANGKFAKIQEEKTSENDLKEISLLTSKANSQLQKSKSLFEEILRLL